MNDERAPSDSAAASLGPTDAGSALSADAVPTRYNPVALAGILLLFGLLCILVAVYFFSVDAGPSGDIVAAEPEAQTTTARPSRPPGVGAGDPFSEEALRRHAEALRRDSVIAARSSRARSASELLGDRSQPRWTYTPSEAQRTARERRALHLQERYYQALAVPTTKASPHPPREAGASRRSGPLRSSRRLRPTGAPAREAPMQGVPLAHGTAPTHIAPARVAPGLPAARRPARPTRTALEPAPLPTSEPQGTPWQDVFPQNTISAQATAAGQRVIGRHPQAPPPSAAGRTAAQGPLSRFVLPIGTVIPIALESAVNADVGGTIVMRVTADVMGRNMEHILIPAGTEVVSDYGSPSLAGQKRIIVGASRMNLPDGRFVDFRSTRAADAAGRAGLSGEVDRHLLSRFGAVGALAVIGTAANLARRPSRGILFGGRERFRDEVLYSGADQVNRVLARALQSQINRRPTVRLEPGMLGRLILNEDLDMGGPYYEEGPDQMRLLEEYRAYQERRAFRRAQALTGHRR